jgi:hypothetical protein
MQQLPMRAVSGKAIEKLRANFPLVCNGYMQGTLETSWQEI